MIQQTVSAILSLSLFVLSALFAAIYYESNSLSRFPDARAHGRADILMLVVQAALVLVGQTFYSVISTWMIIITAAAAGILWMAAYFVFMPYYQHSMNCANISGAAAFLWAVLCLTFNNYYPATDAAVWLYCGAPVAALAGLTLANFRANYILKASANNLANAFEVELKGRYMLHAAIWGHPLEKASESAALNGTKQSSSSQAEGKGSEDAVGEAELSDDAEDRAVQLRKLIPPEVLANVQQLYRQGATRFRTSSILHVFCARFYSVYLGNRHMQFSHLLQAEKRSPATDVSYLVFQARKLAEDTLGGGAGMSAMNRVTFEKYAADARRYVMLAAQKQLAFWAELLESLPDLSRLHRLSTEINDAVVAAEKCFGELFAINPQSLGVIRLYAAFNTHVTCNLDKSMALTAEADRLEDMKSKDHSMEGATRLQFMAESTLDVMAENTAIITLGASARNLGLISAANASACKLFGYARLQLERRSAFTLLPRLLDSYYEKSLKRYINTGEGTIVDYNRIIFGLHKTGAIVPLLSSVRDAPSEGGPPSFIWLMRELRTPSQYIIMDESNTVLAATAGASTILGVDHSAIASHEIRLPDYIAEWHLPSVQNDLISPQGAIIKVEARVSVDVDKVHDNDGGSISSDKVASDDDHEDDDKDAEMDAEMNAAVKAAGAEGTAPAETRTAIQETWIRVHLQHVELEELEFWVAHCQRIANMDSVTMQRIEQRRAQLLASADELTNTAAKRGSVGSINMNRRPSDGMSIAFRRPSEAAQHPSFGTTKPVAELVPARRPSEVLRRASIDSESAQHFAQITKDTLPIIKLPRHIARDSTPSSPVLTSQPNRTHKFKPHRNLDQPMQGLTERNSDEPDIIAMLHLPGSVDAPDHSRPRRTSSQDDAIEFDRPARTNPPVLHLRRSSQEAPLAGGEVEGGAHKPVFVTKSGTGDPGNEIGVQGSLLLDSNASHSSYPSKSSLKQTTIAQKVSSKKSVDHDGIESRSSGGSSRGTTVSKSMVRLRRLLSDGTRGLLPGLWWLRVVGIGITILAIVLAVTVAIIARASFYDYMDHLTYVRGGAQRLHYKADVYYSLQVSEKPAPAALPLHFHRNRMMQDIVFHARGWTPLSEEALAERRVFMQGNATMFSDTAREMFEMAQTTAMAAQYTTRYLPITTFDLPPNGVEGRYK
jgi:PAS domain S-box-containing protein